jgi:hypothetical protein
MAAVAYKVALTLRKGNAVKSLFLTASDVNAAALVFPSGGTELQLAAQDCYIVDWINAPSYGTDTTTVSIYINGVDTGIRVINSANQSGTYNRQIQSSPIYVPAGALVKFVQNT